MSFFDQRPSSLSDWLATFPTGSPYTGIGSRRTPDHILEIMTNFARKLASNGWILRSGGAEGADKAFERGAGKGSEIYLAEHANEEAMRLASQFHPAWQRCGNYARKLHARNCFQVLGKDLNSPSKFVCCWTPDGSLGDSTSRETGGTGQALRIAWAYSIPILNLSRADDLEFVKEHLDNQN